MKSTKINKETLLIIKEIKSIKKPRSINPLIEKLKRHFQIQLESLDVQLNQLKEENKRLNRI